MKDYRPHNFKLKWWPTLYCILVELACVLSLLIAHNFFSQFPEWIVILYLVIGSMFALFPMLFWCWKPWDNNQKNVKNFCTEFFSLSPKLTKSYLASLALFIITYSIVFSIFAFIVHDSENKLVCFLPPSKFVIFQSLIPFVFLFLIHRNQELSSLKSSENYDCKFGIMSGFVFGIIGIVAFIVLMFIAPIFVGY